MAHHHPRNSKLPASSNDDLGLAPMSDSDSDMSTSPPHHSDDLAPEFSSPQPMFPTSKSRLLKRGAHSSTIATSSRASPPRAIHTPTSPMAVSEGGHQAAAKHVLPSAPASPPTPAPSPSPTSKKAPDWSTAAEHEEWQARQLRMIFAEMNDAEKQRLLGELLNMCNSAQLAFVHEFVSPRLKKDPFMTLPNELCLRILTFIDEPKTLVRASQVSRRWYQLVNDDMAWKALCEKHAFKDASIEPYSDLMRDISPPPEPQTTSPTLRSKCRCDWPMHSPGEPCPVSTTSQSTLRPIVSPRNPSADSNISSSSRRSRRRPKALTYRTHFKQRYQIETAWRTGGKMEQRQLSPDQGVVTSLHLTEEHIFVALDNAKIHVFDVEGNHQLTLKGHIMGVWAMAPCGNTHLVSGGCDRDVRMWDVRTGQCPLTMRGHTSTVRCLKLANDKTAISGSRDTTLRIWDLATGICKNVLIGHQASVRCLDIHGDLVVSGSYDTTAKIWSISEGTCLRTLTGHFSQIYAVAFDGVRIATGSLDTSVRIWDPTDGRCLNVLQGHTSLVGQLQLNSSTLVTGGSDGSVRVWSLQTYQPIHRLAAHDNSVTSLQFDEARIVSGGSDGRVKVWDLHAGSLVRELGLPADAVWRVVFEREKAVVLAQRGGRTVMEVWNFAPPPEDDGDDDERFVRNSSPASEPDQSLLDAYGAASVADEIASSGGSGSAPPTSAGAQAPSSKDVMRGSSEGPDRRSETTRANRASARASRGESSVDSSGTSANEDVRMEG